MNLRQLTLERDIRYRRTPELSLKSIQDALAFVNERRFIYFWPIEGTEMPSLWQAVAGNRPVPSEHDDPGHVTWGWKDSMLDQRCWYYGKLLRKKGTIVSLDTLPYFYALSENYGDPDDYLTEYQAGTLTAEAKQIMQALLEKGPMDTLTLRREARLASQDSKGRFEKALTDLQAGLKILPTGIAEAGAWKYAYRYDLVTRWFPDLSERARPIGRGEARLALLLYYLDGVVAATPEQIARLFGWSQPDTARALAHLADEGQVIPDREIEGLRGRYVVRVI